MKIDIKKIIRSIAFGIICLLMTYISNHVWAMAFPVMKLSSEWKTPLVLGILGFLAYLTTDFEKWSK